MTTVVYRAPFLAADRRSTRDGTIDGGASKVARRNDGALIGIAGDQHMAEGLVRWFLAGERPADKPVMRDGDRSCGALIVRPDGSIEEHMPTGWIRLEVEFYAMGSGMDVAYGALEMGATARQAVEVAARRDMYTGNGIDVLDQRRSPDDADWVPTRRPPLLVDER